MTKSRMRFDLPMPDEHSRVFWDAAREHRLVIKRCKSCGKAHHYPRPHCPYCWSSEVRWEEASGRAILYTYSIIHHNDLPPFDERVPYVAAVVDLAEGPRVMTNLVGVDFDEVRIGMPLQVDFSAISDEVTIPVFRACREAT